MSRLPPARRWTLVAVCVVAGGLAVPLHPAATPVSAAVAGLLALLGVYVWRWSGLPLLIRSAPRSGRWRLVQPGLWMGLGLLVGLLVLAVIRIVIEPAVPSIGARMTEAGTLPFWRRAIIIYVAAVGEELVFRLVLLSAIAGLMARLVRPRLQVPTAGVVWLANGISALAFAAAHLPAWMPASLTAGLIAAVVILNAVGALVCGHVFATRGIAAAILVHAGADCAIQFVGPFTG